jgi:2-hydroxychromene-2-carboxylate isomerase
MSDLQVFIDFKSPYAFIAKDLTYALEAEFGIEIDWYPLTLNIGSYLGTAKKNDAGKVVESKRSGNQWLSVKYAYKDARRYANLRGLTLKGTQKIWDTSLAGIAMLWAKEQGHDVLKQFIDISFERFWRRELDLEDIEVVTGLLSESGATVAGFDAWQAGPGRDEHDALQLSFLESGIYGVPTYRISGQTYFGREHLPRVRWHLSGEMGPLPDVANDSVLSAI